jgi:hypothetical protein
MNQSVTYLFIVNVLASISGCNNFETGLVTTKESDKFEQVKVTHESIKQTSEILSRDYATAEKALKKAVMEKDKKTILLGLKSPILTIRKKTAEAIAGLGDKMLVSELINTLSGNQILLDGGTETKIIQDDLDKAIISALEKLTEIKFEVSGRISPEDIAEILRLSREWLKNNQP